jgi:hypothetical protein
MLKLVEFLHRLGVAGGSVERRDHPDKGGLVSWKIRLRADSSFHKNVGVRYCAAKQARLAAASSYWSMQETLQDQTREFITEVFRLYDSDAAVSLKAAREQVIASGRFINMVPYYSHPPMEVVHYRRRHRAMQLRRMNYSQVRDAATYFEDAGCLSWFQKGCYATDQTSNTAPTYTLALKDVRPAGRMPTYDISVPETTSFVANGVVAHNCIPSRMTIGHLIETALGMVAAQSGEQIDGTPFVLPETLDVDPDDHEAVISVINELLIEHGCAPMGERQLHDGFSGEKLKALVFMGPISYYKLKHMVLDKHHARSRGPRQLQTRQAVEGRGRDGGHKFGEMEGDSTKSHGAMGFMQERLLHSSDKADVPFCVRCGEAAQPPKRRVGHELFAAAVHADLPFCSYCLRHDTVCNREIPYSYKTSTQELQALHVHSGFEFEGAPPRER